MTQPLRVGIKLSQDAPVESYKAVWKIADEARFDHCWAMDHLVDHERGGWYARRLVGDPDARERPQTAPLVRQAGPLPCAPGVPAAAAPNRF
jgi:hypothetical protein